MASAAESLRSVCGSQRMPPAIRTHRFPAAALHLGQAMEDICFGVSSFTFTLPPGLRFLDGHGAIF
jgi:hypothetical protein